MVVEINRSLTRPLSLLISHRFLLAENSFFQNITLHRVINYSQPNVPKLTLL
jgi:hypothetical protein